MFQAYVVVPRLEFLSESDQREYLGGSRYFIIKRKISVQSRVEEDLNLGGGCDNLMSTGSLRAYFLQ